MVMEAQIHCVAKKIEKLVSMVIDLKGPMSLPLLLCICKPFAKKLMT